MAQRLHNLLRFRQVHSGGRTKQLDGFELAPGSNGGSHLRLYIMFGSHNRTLFPSKTNYIPIGYAMRTAARRNLAPNYDLQLASHIEFTDCQPFPDATQRTG